MSLKDSLIIGERQQERLDRLYAGYRQMYLDPDNCSPKFIVRWRGENIPSWDEQLADPLVMLRAGLEQIRPHLELEDDAAAIVRVNFGTAQPAAAFGCRLVTPPGSIPAAGSHPLENAADVYHWDKPDLEAGWYGKLRKWTEIWLENLPDGVNIQHPDIQGPFNTAHLVRGNDILTDFYDDPEAVDALLDLITDYMIDLVPWLKGMISDDDEWFFDWSAMWKGQARISNCSMHMISPQFYKRFVMAHDVRLLEAIGGGRMHYCGSFGEVIDEFFQVPALTGLDYDVGYHDLWTLCERAPERVTLCQNVGVDGPVGERLLAGDWPDKRNLIIHLSDIESKEHGREMLEKFRRSVPGGVDQPA